MIKAFAQTDIGRVRDGNEDSFLVGDFSSEQGNRLPRVMEFSPEGGAPVFMVSDGMGGAAAGEVASSLAVKTVRGKLRGRQAGGEAQFVESLVQALEAANRAILDHAKQHPQLRGMGATATLAGFFKSKIYVAQVGDSRAYLIRQNMIRQLTRDQSFVNQLLEAGKITEAEAESHPRRNVILQALGNQGKLAVAAVSIQPCDGDYLLLCSDGLSGLVKKEEMRDIITGAPDLPEAVQRLIMLANERGGPDNITVVLSRFSGPGLPAPDAKEPPAPRVLRKFEASLSSGAEESQARSQSRMKTVLLAVILALAGLALAWFIAGFMIRQERQKQTGDRLNHLHNRYESYLAGNRENLRLLPASHPLLADTARVAGFLKEARSALEQNDFNRAAALGDSAEKRLAGWKAAPGKEAGPSPGEANADRAVLRAFWLENWVQIKQKTGAVNPGNSLPILTSAETERLAGLPSQEFHAELQRYLQNAVDSAYPYVQTRMAALDRRHPRWQSLNDSLAAARELLQTSRPSLLSSDIEEARNGSKNFLKGLDILRSLKEKLHSLRQPASPDSVNLGNE